MSKNQDVVEHANVNIAVNVKNVCFSFQPNQKNVLNHVHMQLPQGSLYGLLGPSGCGKTTLFRCIIGRLIPKSGSINIFGETPGSNNCSIPGPGVGYMPQDFALFPEFTAAEILKYFGQLYHMKSSLISERTEILTKLLLVPKNRKIANLSGGQRRRVSLATSLIHAPPLLLLDEPTVGLDPVIQMEIWNYLNILCRQSNISIIITTHYIEEARNADIVGFMRNGRILAQSNPEQLLERYQLTSLEALFLRLCEREPDSIETTDFCQVRPKTINQNIEMNPIHREDISEPSITNAPVELKPYHRTNIDLWHVWALFKKNMLRLIRSYIIFTFFIFLPSIQTFLFFMSLKKNPGNFPVAIYSPETPARLSAKYLSYLESNSVKMKYFESHSEATEYVKLGKARTVIHIPFNYTEGISQRINLLTNADQSIIDSSNIKLEIDMSNQVIGYYVIQALYYAFKPFSEQILSGMGYNVALLAPPIEIMEPIYGKLKRTMLISLYPGVLVILSFFATAALSIICLIKEHKDGMLERTLSASVTSLEFIISHLLSNILLLTFQMTVLVFVSFYLIGFEIKGSFYLVIGLIYLQGLAGVMFGLWISSITHDEIAAGMIGISFLLSSTLISGLMWPIQSHPPWLYMVSAIFPQTLTIDSMRSIIIRGWSITNPTVAMGFFISTIWILFFLTVAIYTFQKSLR